MFGKNNKLEKEFYNYQKRVNKRLWDLENPFKFKLGDKVKIKNQLIPILATGESDNTIYIITKCEHIENDNYRTCYFNQYDLMSETFDKTTKEPEHMLQLIKIGE
jgi:hypothetical protein